MPKKCNWWYFLIFAGIVIPGVVFFSLGQPFELSFFRNKTIMGLNPFSSFFFNFLAFALMVLSFKIVERIKIPATTLFIVYSTLGLLFTLFLVQGLLSYSMKYVSQNQYQRYIQIENLPDERSFPEKQAMLLTHIIILCVFSFFLFVNRPKK